MKVATKVIIGSAVSGMLITALSITGWRLAIRAADHVDAPTTQDAGDAATERAREVAVAKELRGSATMLLVLGAVATATSVGTSMWLCTVLRRRLLSTKTSLERVISERRIDLGQRFGTTSADEFSQLGTALNALLERIGGVVSTIRTAADEMDKSSSEIEFSATALSGAASSQAAAVEEVSAATHEVAESARRNTADVASACMLATNSKEAATNGDGLARRLAAAMAEVQQSSTKIGTVLEVINDVAAQTNLLALNAAVEAARAGVAGAGFGVVADEVGVLAKRTQQAARDTQEMMHEVADRVTRSASLSTEMTAQFAEIGEGTREVQGLLDQLSSATAEQAESAAQISKGATTLDNAGQSMAAQSEELSASAATSTQASKGLRALVEQFRM